MTASTPKSSTDVALRLSFADAEDLLSAWARHLAEGAMWVNQPRPSADAVQVTFAIPGHELPALKARVVQRPGPDTGFWLEVEPTPELTAYVGRQARQQRQGQRSPLAPALATRPKRAFERFETALAVQFDNFPELAAEYVTNISRGGLFIRSDTPPPMRAQVELSLRLPDGQVVRVTAEVVHRISAEEAQARGLIAGAGVAFVGGSANPAFAPIEAMLQQFSQRRPLVLLVDADVAFRDRLAEALTAAGVDVDAASNGREALLRLIDNFFSYDLLVTELHIPQIDGRALIDRIRLSGGEMGLKVVVLTRAGPEAELAAREATGPTRVLLKRQGLPELVAALRLEVGLTEPYG